MSYGYTPNESASNTHMVDQNGILVTKRTILSNPGTKLDYGLYYNAVNTLVQASQVTWTQGRYKQSLSSPQFGAQSTIIIPNGSFVQTLSLHLEFPAALAANMVLNRGWGFAAIQSISFLMGSSNVPQITIQGSSIYQLMLAQTEGVLKRSEMLALAGQECKVVDGTIPVADLIIPLPFSVFAGKDSPFPFDTNLLQNPITINVQLNPLRNFCSGTGVPSYPYYQFGKAEASLKLGDMLDKSAGLRRKMQDNPDLIYGYPFNHFQSYQASFDSYGKTSSGQGSGQTINLLGFINADLLGIVIGVQKAIDTNPTRTNDVINPLIYEEVADVSVMFNGLVMHSTTGQQHKLTGMNSVNDATYVQQSIIDIPAVSGVGPFTSTAANVYPVYIDFAQVRSMNFHKEYENVWRIANNTLTLNLRTPNVVDGTKMVVYCTYVYNGILDVKNGETEIYFS